MLCGCSLVLDGERHKVGAPGLGDGGFDGGSAPDGAGVDGGSTLDGSDIDGGRSTPVPASEFCEEFTEIVCFAEQECCSTPRAMGDCRLSVDAACQTGLAAAARDGRTNYDEAIARATLNEGWNIASQCDQAAAQTWFTYEILDIFAGTVPRGEMCESAVVPDPIQLLTCVAPNVCRLTGVFWVRECLPRLPTGGACLESGDCEPGLYCDSGTSVCTEAKPNGAVCDNMFACESLRCEGGDGARTCQPRTQDSIFCGLGSE